MFAADPSGLLLCLVDVDRTLLATLECAVPRAASLLSSCVYPNYHLNIMLMITPAKILRLSTFTPFLRLVKLRTVPCVFSTRSDIIVGAVTKLIKLMDNNGVVAIVYSCFVY